jgi:hypothetical protein
LPISRQPTHAQDRQAATPASFPALGLLFTEVTDFKRFAVVGATRPSRLEVLCKVSVVLCGGVASSCELLSWHPSGIIGMSYCIVQFAASEGGNVAIVVNKWLTPKKTEIFWPPTKDPKVYDKLLQRCSSPNERWSMYGVDRLFYETGKFFND